MKPFDGVAASSEPGAQFSHGASATAEVESPLAEFVYAGPVHGFAQVALGVCCSAESVRGTAFVDCVRPRHPLSDFAEATGANVREVGLASQHAKLWQVEQAAQSYVKRRNCTRPGSTELIPFGLDHPRFRELLKEALLAAMPPSLQEAPPTRLWLVAGSGTILQVLMEIWPRTEFMVVQVGKALPEAVLRRAWQLRLFHAPMPFEAPAEAGEMPPYPSVQNYDAKLWGFVRRYAVEGDVVWNVGKDPPAEAAAVSTSGGAVVSRSV